MMYLLRTRQQTKFLKSVGTVWCGLHGGGTIEPNFFKNDEMERIKRYRSMINNVLFPNLTEINLEDFWFQQDSAVCVCI